MEAIQGKRVLALQVVYGTLSISEGVGAYIPDFGLCRPTHGLLEGGRHSRCLLTVDHNVFCA